MHEIDFLPAEYRQNHVRRQSQPWRIIVVVVFTALVVSAAVGQHIHRERFEAELAAVMPEYEKAVSLNGCLGNLQSQLQLVRADAELFTYLRHPWPRTRIISALLAPLPDGITFEQLNIQQQGLAGRVRGEQLSRSEKDAEEQELANMPPAVRDLKQLRDAFDLRRTVVTITGVTTDSAALHHYLGELGRDSLFRDVDFSIESDDIGRSANLRFNAVLTVQPGYGQPGGPSDTDRKVPTEAEPNTV